jgi:hypothetical protein
MPVLIARNVECIVSNSVWRICIFIAAVLTLVF